MSYSEKDGQVIPERCSDKLEEDGSIYRCTLLLGHSGPHENGDWEWWGDEEEIPA